MNGQLTLTSQFHIAPRNKGRQQIRKGIAPERPTGRIQRIARLMALAIRCRELIRTGVATDQSMLAGTGRITTARMTQIMSLLNLAPDIQEHLLFLPRIERGRDVVKETDIRSIVNTLDWRKQRMLWATLQDRRGMRRRSPSFCGPTSQSVSCEILGN
jgi:hypothetical protein